MSSRIRTRVGRTPGGRRLVVSRRISAPAAAAWDMLVSVMGWPDWGPGVSGVRGVDGGIEAGSHGEVHVVGVWVPFSIETCDDESRRWTWRVAGVPATGRRVDPVGPERCSVSLEVPVLAGSYVAACAVTLRRIEQLARQRAHG